MKTSKSMEGTKVQHLVGNTKRKVYNDTAR